MERLFFPVTQKKASQAGIDYSSAANKKALFPTQLRDLRKEKGVSQEELSNVLGVSKSTIGLWETGDTLPDAGSLHDLAVYYGVSADYLIGLSCVKTNDMDVKAICEYTGLTAETVKSLNSYTTMASVISSFVTRFFEDMVVYNDYSLEDMCEDVVKSAHLLAIDKRNMGEKLERDENNVSFTISALDASNFYLSRAVDCVIDIVRRDIEMMVDELEESCDGIVSETHAKRVWALLGDEDEHDQRNR